MESYGRLLATVLAMAISAPASAAPGIAREQLGRSAKLAILVDKVMQPTAGGVTQEWMVAEAAEAGFNVFSPRLGYERLDEVRQVSQWCQKYGIYHMPWMRGTRDAPGGPEAEGKRLLWASGNEQALWSPNSDELWEWIGKYIIQYAKISADNPHLMGVFLDYENYAKRREENCYDLSYDDTILGKFARATGIELPELDAKQRKPWLEQQGLHEQFSQFQINHWRERCRTLRQAVDQHAPSFQFCIYPAPGTPFILEACYPEWATEQAPLILADACTYGRAGAPLQHADALDANRAWLSERQAFALSKGGPLMYTGGIDPVVKGADPEFCGKNAAMISETTDGYWVFYEGPKYQDSHADYFKWFAWANKAAVEGRLQAWRERRQTRDTFTLAELVPETDKIQVLFSDYRPRIKQMLEEDGRYEVHQMQGSSLRYLSGAQVVILQNFQIPLESNHAFVRALRRYVERGGGLFLAYDTAWYMASPFPAVAVRDVPSNKVEVGRYVADTELLTDQAHPALGGVPARTRFVSEYRKHMIFRPGPQGEVLIRNTFGDPVYVAGEAGRGRVVFSGCYYGYRRALEGTEREVFDAIVEWLAGVED